MRTPKITISTPVAKGTPLTDKGRSSSRIQTPNFGGNCCSEEQVLGFDFWATFGEIQLEKFIGLDLNRVNKHGMFD